MKARIINAHLHARCAQNSKTRKRIHEWRISGTSILLFDIKESRTLFIHPILMKPQISLQCTTSISLQRIASDVTNQFFTLGAQVWSDSVKHKQISPFCHSTQQNLSHHRDPLISYAVKPFQATPKLFNSLHSHSTHLHECVTYLYRR